jgi:hypothetical protein
MHDFMALEAEAGLEFGLTLIKQTKHAGAE